MTLLKISSSVSHISLCAWTCQAVESRFPFFVMSIGAIAAAP